MTKGVYFFPRVYHGKGLYIFPFLYQGILYQPLPLDSNPGIPDLDIPFYTTSVVALLLLIDLFLVLLEVALQY